MKSYRDKELKSYVIAIILIYCLLDNAMSRIIKNSDMSILQFIIELLNLTIVSSAIYAFTYVFDSLYSGTLKSKLVFLFCAEPGQIIFDKILNNINDIRFSVKDVKYYYKEIYAHMPQKKKQKRTYQNQQWYQIYHHYKNIEMVESAGKDYRLSRDIFIATINTFIIYIILCFLTNVVQLNYYYIGVLIGMLVLSNVAARRKGAKWVYNVIAHDISEKIDKEKCAQKTNIILNIK